MWPGCPSEEETAPMAGSGVGIRASSVLHFRNGLCCGEPSHPRSHLYPEGPNPVIDECKDEKAWPLPSNMRLLQPPLFRSPLKLLCLHQSPTSAPRIPGYPSQESFPANILDSKLCRSVSWQNLTRTLLTCLFVKQTSHSSSTTTLSLSEIQRPHQFPKFQNSSKRPLNVIAEYHLYNNRQRIVSG